jgi:RNA methyltransferase, TrmH family
VVVVEGAELLSVAIAAGHDVEAVYVAPEGDGVPAVVEVVSRVLEAGGRVFDLAPGVMERIAATVSPQPLMAVVSYAPALPASLDGANLVVVCVDVRDPGNLGTVIRTADAAGVGAVVCCEGTVDPTNPKTVRATAGSLFHLPVVAGGAAAATVSELAARGFTTVATVVRGGTDYTAFDWTGPVALILGNESTGLDDALVETLDAQVSIPMAGRSESLNVGVSAAVLCFEALRQRRVGTSPGAASTRSTMSPMNTSATHQSAVPPAGPEGTAE